MIILGINGGIRSGYMDAAASLVVDGRVVAAIEEERLNRIKMSPGQLPESSIKAVLTKAHINIHDVDVVASHGATWGGDYEIVLRDYFRCTFGHTPKIERIDHHLAHAASAFYPSGFDKAMILTIDNSGDGISTMLAIGDGNSIETIRRIPRPNSLGIFYSMITQFCGLRREYDEYKLMALAAFGDRNRHDFDWLLRFGRGEYLLNPDYLVEMKEGEPSLARQQMFFNERLIQKLGPKRLLGQPITQFYKDIAASAQRHFENVLIDIVRNFHRSTGLRKLCLAGGAALNCVANQKLMNLDCVDEIFIQPAAGDAGVSLGAAYVAAGRAGERLTPMTHPYLGRGFSNAEIEKVLKNCGVRYETTQDPAFVAAKRVAQNQVVGWFQGEDEFGPRALGNRSLLANPLNPEMKRILNEKIKYREDFRPFSPSVLEEEAPLYFEGKSKQAPYMNITFDLKEGMGEKLPAVSHCDHTARIQTVSESQNPLYHRYLIALKNETGFGVTVNTSFNTREEPIVASPEEALASFYSSGLECLVMGNYVVEKLR